MKHLCEISTGIGSAEMTAGKCGFNFERAPRFRAALQKVLSPHKELYNRKVYEARQSSILLYFKPSTLAMADDKPQLSTSRQVDVEGVHICDLPALRNSEDNEMSIDNSLLLFLHPTFLCLLPPQPLMTQHSTPSLPPLCLPACEPSSQMW